MTQAANILAINPGSTSTKIGLFRDATLLLAHSLQHNPAELAACGPEIWQQLALRLQCVEDALESCGLRLELAAVVGRGGLLHPVAGGTYRVNQVMLDEVRRAERGEHASNLGAFLAEAIARRSGLPAFIVDPVAVDEWEEVARFSGLAELPRPCLSHALNSKAIARRHARACGVPYQLLRLVVAHLGSGHTISAHREGRMVDATNSREEGAFSSERAGGVPSAELVRLCFSSGLSRAEVEAMLVRRGGLISYLGTGELREVEQRIEAGDERAAHVFAAMCYQIAKEIGAMATVLEGRMDAILLTGGMAHSARLVAAVQRSVGWIAPVKVYAGEDELQSLAEGAWRVLRGEEAAHEYGPAKADPASLQG
jgi:butyrate kinase